MAELSYYPIPPPCCMYNVTVETTQEPGCNYPQFMINMSILFCPGVSFSYGINDCPLLCNTLQDWADLANGVPETCITLTDKDRQDNSIHVLNNGTVHFEIEGADGVMSFTIPYIACSNVFKIIYRGILEANTRLRNLEQDYNQYNADRQVPTG